MSSLSVMLKIAVLTPIPRARVITTTAVNPGCRQSPRMAYRMSLVSEFICGSPSVSLLVSQRHQWIDLRRAARRNVTGQSCDQSEQDKNSCSSKAGTLDQVAKDRIGCL